MKSLAKRWGVLLLALLPLLPLWKCIFRGEAIGPWDHLARQLPNSTAPIPTSAWDILQADGILQFYVWRDLVFQSWRAGEVPAINPYAMAGTPLLANSQSGALYPLHVLVSFLNLPTHVSMILLVWIHLAIAAIGVRYLTLRLGAGESMATLAGGAVVLSHFFVAWSGLPSVVSTCAYIPWLLYALTPPRDENAPQGRNRSLLIFAVATGMMLLAGHLQFAAYGLMAAVLYALGQTLVSRNPAALLTLAIGGLMGGAIAMPQVGPVLDYGKLSHRKNTPSEEGYSAFIKSAIQPYEWAGLAHPHLLGDAQTNLDAKLGETPVGSYWPQYTKLGANHAEGAVFFAPILLVGLFFLKSRAKQVAPLAVVGLLGFLIASGSEVNKLMYFALPNWSSTGSIGRASILILLALVPIGAVGLQTLLDRKSDEKPIQQLHFAVLALPFAVLGLGLNLVGLAKAQSTFIPNLPPEWFPTLVAEGSAMGQSSSLVIAFLGALAVGVALMRPREGARVVLVSGIAIGMIGTGTILRTAPFQDLTVKEFPTDLNSRTVFVNDDWNMFGTPSNLLPPNLASLSKIQDVAGYDSLIDRNFVGRLQEITGTNPSPATNGNMMFVKLPVIRNELKKWGVGTMVTREIPPSMSMKSLPEGPYMTINLGGTMVDSPSGKSKVSKVSSSKVVVSTDASDREAVVKFRMLPGMQLEPGVTAIEQDGWIALKWDQRKESITISFGPPVWVGLLPTILVVMLLGLLGNSVRLSKPNAPDLDPA